MPVSEAWHQRLANARAVRQHAQQWRTRRTRQPHLVNFADNDYLGLATDPRVQAAQAEGARRFGAGAGASHLVNGHHAIHDALEDALAAWTGRERAVLFSTGYMANLGVLQALADTPHGHFSRPAQSRLTAGWKRAERRPLTALPP